MEGQLAARAKGKGRVCGCRQAKGTVQKWGGSGDDVHVRDVTPAGEGKAVHVWITY